MREMLKHARLCILSLREGFRWSVVILLTVRIVCSRLTLITGFWPKLLLK